MARSSDTTSHLLETFVTLIVEETLQQERHTRKTGKSVSMSLTDKATKEIGKRVQSKLFETRSAAVLAVLQDAFADHVAQAESQRAYYDDTAFADLGRLTPQAFGSLTEGVISYFGNAAGHRTKGAATPAYDLDSRAFGCQEVKGSRVREGRRFGFGALDTRKHETATLAGFDRDRLYLWVIPASELNRLWRNKSRCVTRKGASKYVGLSRSEETGKFSINFKIDSPPAWLSQYEVLDETLKTDFAKALGKK